MPGDVTLFGRSEPPTSVTGHGQPNDDVCLSTHASYDVERCRSSVVTPVTFGSRASGEPTL